MGLANPANRVNAVMALRAPSPYILPSVENAASVRPVHPHTDKQPCRQIPNDALRKSSDKSPSANRARH